MKSFEHLFKEVKVISDQLAAIILIKQNCTSL